MAKPRIKRPIRVDNWEISRWNCCPSWGKAAEISNQFRVIAIKLRDRSNNIHQRLAISRSKGMFISILSFLPARLVLRYLALSYLMHSLSFRSNLTWFWLITILNDCYSTSPASRVTANLRREADDCEAIWGKDFEIV